jgi:hypothetical protein
MKNGDAVFAYCDEQQYIVIVNLCKVKLFLFSSLGRYVPIIDCQNYCLELQML